MNCSSVNSGSASAEGCCRKCLLSPQHSRPMLGGFNQDHLNTYLRGGMAFACTDRPDFIWRRQKDSGNTCRCTRRRGRAAEWECPCPQRRTERWRCVFRPVFEPQPLTGTQSVAFSCHPAGETPTVAMDETMRSLCTENVKLSSENLQQLV